MPEQTTSAFGLCSNATTASRRRRTLVHARPLPGIRFVCTTSRSRVQHIVIPAEAGTQRTVIPAEAGTQRTVIPAEAGTQFVGECHWIPACAGDDKALAREKNLARNRPCPTFGRIPFERCGVIPYAVGLTHLSFPARLQSCLVSLLIDVSGIPVGSSPNLAICVSRLFVPLPGEFPAGEFPEPKWRNGSRPQMPDTFKWLAGSTDRVPFRTNRTPR